MSTELQNLLPKKPFCTNCFTKEGVQIRSRHIAVQKRYIQMNPPAKQSFLTLDLDYAGAAMAASDESLPQPTFTVINRENKHAHVIYMLRTPIITSFRGRQKPMRYLEAIEQAYTARLDADNNYVGLISKNPWCEKYWDVFYNGNLAYDLDELAEAVDLPRLCTKKTKTQTNPKGRNCTLFDNLRLWAYRAIADYWRPNGESMWFDAVIAKVHELNNFENQLGHREVIATARSVWRWTWRNMTPQSRKELNARTHTPDQQRARIGKRWEGNDEKKALAMIQLAQGRDKLEIAVEFKVSERTIQRWRKQAKT